MTNKEIFESLVEIEGLVFEASTEVDGIEQEDLIAANNMLRKLIDHFNNIT